METCKHDPYVRIARHTAMVVVLPLLVLLLLGSSSPAANAGDGHEFTVVDMRSLKKPRAVCSGHRVAPPSNGTWLPLYHPLGPCSPSFPGAAKAKKPSLAAVLRQDRLRVQHIHKRLSGDVRESKGSRKPPAPVEETQLNNQAAISVQMGSPRTQRSSQALPAATDDAAAALSQIVVLDTATDVPWVRCIPCVAEPCANYDPARSATYAAVPCNSTACARLGRYANGCVNNQCQYRITNDSDGTLISSGTYSTELLTIGSSGDAVSGFRFGCSRSEPQGQGGDGELPARADGIMALGRGVQSLLAQTSSTYGNAFSYCLPPSETERGFFMLGAQAPYRFVLTPMVRDRGAPGPYRVLLRAITVNGQPLNVPAEVFAAGTVLESRTVVTRLPLTAYAALRAAFRSKMAVYRRAAPQEDLDTCYDFTGVRYVRLPRIALVFDPHAVVELDRSGILFHDCLAFTANNDDSKPGILGNVQQKTIEVLHDVAGGNIGFRLQAC